MLAERGAVEQRYRAVLEVLEDGVSVTDVARKYGVARQTVHTWLRRYAEGVMGALADRPTKPGSCPHEMAAATEGRIVHLRREHPGWGSVADPAGAGAGGGGAAAGPVGGVPGAGPPRPGGGTTAALEAGGLPAVGAAAAMDLWQMDVMGRVSA